MILIFIVLSLTKLKYRIMKLSGKCEIAFNEYCKNKGLENFNNKKYALIVCKSFWNTLFIDFFDSVGIYIGIDPLYDMQGTFRVYLDKYGFQSISRQEATEKAIEKANEIYNSK